MKVIVAGGRDFKPSRKQVEWLIKKLLELNTTEEVCGMAKGADMVGYYTARRLSIPVKKFPADWKKFGKPAGPIRNEEMAKYADACILFPGEKGTNNMRMLAETYKLILIEWKNEI